MSLVKMVFLVNISSSEDLLSNNFHDLSDKTRKTIENIWFIGVIFPACLVGVPANILTCMVFWRQGLQDRMTFYLFSLALVDCLHLMCTLTIFPVSSILRSYDDTVGENYYLKSLISLVSVLYGSRTTSSLISAVIAVERCVCVVFPLWASSLVKSKKMTIAVIGLFLFFQAAYIPYTFSLEVRSMKNNASEVLYLKPTRFSTDNQTALLLIQCVLLDMVVPVANFIILVVVTAITIFKLRAAIRWRQTSVAVTGNSNSQQTALTTMLVLLAITQIVTMAPLVASQFVYFFSLDSLNIDYNTYMLLHSVIHSISALNDSVHFCIYYRRSSRFRQIFCSMLCPMDQRRPD